MYLKHFPSLVRMVLANVEDEASTIHLLRIHHQSILLRQIISYSVRITSFTSDLLHLLQNDCKLLFKACCKFDLNVSPRMWVLCNVLPVHANITFTEYGFGIGCNTMEGREQKHQRIAQYANNTTIQCRWPRIFRHEYIHLLHLRENGFDTCKYRKRKNQYIPPSPYGSCKKCCLTCNKSELSTYCELCDHALMQQHVYI